MGTEGSDPASSAERDDEVSAEGDAPVTRWSRWAGSRLGRFVRAQPAGLAVCVVALLVYLWFYLGVRAKLMPGNSDPHYIWLYARSLVFDGDLNFRNDYQICGDPFRLGKDYGTGHPANPYYLGPSLFMAPALAILRLVMTLPADATPDVVAACRGPVAGAAMGVGCIVGALALFVSYRVARRYVSDGPAAVSAALFGWGGLLAAYSGLWPNYSHVYATFGVALIALTTLRAVERPRALSRWAIVAFAVALSVLQRPPQLIYGLLPLVAAMASLRSDRRRLAAALVILAAGAVAGVAPLLLLYKHMYGHYTANPVSGEYLHLAHAHPFLLLFAPHGGLFFTTPVAWVAVVGAFFAARRRDVRLLVIPLLIAGAVEGYLYSSGLDWHGSGTFGARRLTTLTPLFVVLGAIFVSRLAAWLEARPGRALVAFALAVIVPVGAMTQGMMLGQATGTVPCCRGASQAELYGEGTKALWTSMDSGLGDLAVLPAALVFAARYGVHPNRWRDATQSNWYIRDFRTLRFSTQGFNLGDPRLLTRGIAKAGSAGKLVAPRARVIFAAEWPFATHLVIRAQSDRPTRMRVGLGRTFGVAWLGEVELAAGSTSPSRVSIPPGTFSSGIVELVLEPTDAAGASVVVQDVRIEDETTYPLP